MCAAFVLLVSHAPQSAYFTSQKELLYLTRQIVAVIVRVLSHDGPGTEQNPALLVVTLLRLAELLSV